MSEYFEKRKSGKKVKVEESDDFIPLPTKKIDIEKICVIGINECLRCVENKSPLIVIINPQIQYNIIYYKIYFNK